MKTCSLNVRFASVLGGAWLLLGIVATARADKPNDASPVYRFSRDVLAPPLKQEELLAIPLDSDVFAATRDGLEDLRLVNAAGEPIPFFLRKVQTTKARAVRSTWSAREPTARPLDDGGLEIIVQLGDKDPHPNGLSLVTPLRNFKQRVRVFVSADGKQWDPAGEETAIFDYSRYMDVRSVGVPFPETDKRHFRIVVDDVTAEQESELLTLTRRLRGHEESDRTEQVLVDRRPFRIERIDFWREVHEEQATGDEKGDYSLIRQTVEQNAEKHQTIIGIETYRQPLTSFQLETADRNFSRHAVVEFEREQGVKKSWRQIGEATLSRVDFKNLKREELSIKFPESRQAKYRIVIDNRDSPALDVSGIKAEGNIDEIVYLAGPDRHDRLLYGSADAERATYDTAAIEELLRKGFQPSRAGLGPQLPGMQSGEPSAFRWSKVLNNPLLLGGVILVLVVALGWGLFQAVKRLDKLPGDQP
jgi:hypothetical protein